MRNLFDLPDEDIYEISAVKIHIRAFTNNENELERKNVKYFTGKREHVQTTKETIQI